jgi:hypothetical protein
MKKLLIAFTALIMSASVHAGLIGFDDGATTQTGTLTYDGIGGAVFGTDILFDSILGTDTPLNDGSALTCVGCSMDFMTGLNTLEGPDLWTFLAGGSLTITGEAWDGGTLIASGVLATGSFISSPTVVGIGTTSALFAGFGLDSKNADLIDYWGFPADTSWTYATTEIALGSCTGSNGGFDCGVSNADFNNISNEVPISGTLGLMALGLMAIRRTRK